jgi:tripartite ATP-independent transporter DctP family solute receptor
MNSMLKTVGMACGLLLAAGFIAGCDSKTSVRAPAQADPQPEAQSAVEETPPPEIVVEAKVIKAGIGVDERNTQYKGLERFKELVETRSGGRLRVDLAVNVRLGDDTETEMIAALRNGSLEMACVSTQSVAGLDKRWMIFDLPYLFPDADTADRVLDGSLGRNYLDSLLTHDLVGMAFWENGFSELTNSVRAIESPGRLKGLKIGTTGSPIHQAAFKALGAKPVPLIFDQRFPALAQKLIDGQGSPAPVVFLQNYHEVQGYLTLTHHFYSIFVFMYGKRLWDALATEEQDIVFQAAQEAGRHQRQINREATVQALADLSNAGVAVSDLGTVQREAFAKATRGVAKQFEADFGADNLKALKNEMAKKTNY